jgi:hypothetical protein
MAASANIWNSRHEQSRQDEVEKVKFFCMYACVFGSELMMTYLVGNLVIRIMFESSAACTHINIHIYTDMHITHVHARHRIQRNTQIYAIFSGIIHELDESGS